MKKIDLNEVLEFDDNVRFEVFKSGEFLGRVFIKDNHLWSVFGFNLDTALPDIVFNRAEYEFKRCSRK